MRHIVGVEEVEKGGFAGGEGQKNREVLAETKNRRQGAAEV